MLIRRATANDLSGIALLHRDSILGLCKTHYAPSQLAVWTAALTPDAYVGLLSTRLMLVAEAGGALLGFGAAELASGLIHATYVRPTAAGRGLGRQLLAAMEVAVLAADQRQVQLHATLNAVSFYERRGYRSQGLTSNRFPDGSELPCMQMTKALRADAYH